MFRLPSRAKLGRKYRRALLASPDEDVWAAVNRKN
jgi:hypothetical protein